MRVVTVLVACDITKADDVHLLLTSTSRSIDWKQDRPCYQTPKEAQRHGYLQVSKEEKPIKRLMVENVAIWNLVEGSDPIEQAVGQVW